MNTPVIRGCAKSVVHPSKFTVLLVSLLLSSPAMAADLQIPPLRPMRMAPATGISPASAPTCSRCAEECRHRGLGPQCETVCSEACKDR